MALCECDVEAACTALIAVASGSAQLGGLGFGPTGAVIGICCGRTNTVLLSCMEPRLSLIATGRCGDSTELSEASACERHSAISDLTMK